VIGTAREAKETSTEAEWVRELETIGAGIALGMALGNEMRGEA